MPTPRLHVRTVMMLHHKQRTETRIAPRVPSMWRRPGVSDFQKVTYPGSNNFSTLAYDGLGRNVGIVETMAGSVTSTKNFVWCGNDRCEQRNSSSTITAQFFSLGETISGTSYFYDPDLLGLTAASVRPFMQLSMIGGHPRVFNPLAHGGSTREITNSSGVIQGQIAYDPFGRATQLQGSLSPDFQYAGYYLHSRSGLNLTRTRAYSAAFGRWIGRDPIGERGGLNLFGYVRNNPISWIDPMGLGIQPVPYWTGDPWEDPLLNPTGDTTLGPISPGNAIDYNTEPGSIGCGKYDWGPRFESSESPPPDWWFSPPHGPGTWPLGPNGVPPDNPQPLPPFPGIPVPPRMEV